VLGVSVRKIFAAKKEGKESDLSGLNNATQSLLKFYMD
jgi:hypothetical protein